MLVTTVIPTIGRPSLARAIESAVGQSDLVIVVGDGIEPDVPAGVMALRIDRPDYPDDPKVRWYQAGVRAFNHGLDHVTSEWFSYLADDDYYLPNHHAALLAASDGADLVYGMSESPGRSGHYGSNWPLQVHDVCMGAWIMRTDTGMRAVETTARSWDTDWWERVLQQNLRVARVNEVVHVYEPAPETRGFHIL